MERLTATAAPALRTRLDDRDFSVCIELRQEVVRLRQELAASWSIAESHQREVVRLRRQLARQSQPSK